jgi:hypothetical protein
LASLYTTTYDAYGTVITPFGTYTNVIRQKYEDSTGISYTWFKANPFSPILSSNFSTSNSTWYFTIYKPTNALSVNKNDTKVVLISLYPNPTTTIINLLIPNEIQLEKVIITDVTGKKVLEQIQNTKSIDVQGLSKGVYFLKAFSGKEQFQDKFIKE